MNARTILIISVLALGLAPGAGAQQTHHGESFTLDTTLNPVKNHVYTATDHIDLIPGFATSPVRYKSTVLQIDNGDPGVYPPEEGHTNSQGRVVGTLGGTVSIGAMGALVYSIPLELPPGINGMQPCLAVTYSNQAGNGLMGWGWSLEGLSSITRTGQTLYHDGKMTTAYLSWDDRFLLDGQRLVEVADYTDSIEFRTERDRMSRVMAYLTVQQGGGLFGQGTYRTFDSFKVWQADGLVMEYGATPDSWIDAPLDSDQAVCWLLDKASDRYGNSILYHYTESTQNGEYYIDRIFYTVNGEQETPAQFRVSFGYSGDRFDHEKHYIGGNSIVMLHLLTSVTVTRESDQKTLLRYEFAYDSSHSHLYHRLISVEKTAFDEDGQEESPMATTVSWDSTEPGQLARDTIANPGFLEDFPFTGDFNGDGYTDLAMVPYKDGPTYSGSVDIGIYLNDRDRGFNHAASLDLTGVLASLDWVHVLDINGDGLDDLVLKCYDTLPAVNSELTMMLAYLNNPASQTFSLVGVRMVPAKADVIVGDFNGDGLQDAVLLEKKYKAVSYGNRSTAVMPHLENAFFLGYTNSQILDTQLNSSSLEHLGPVFNEVVADYNGDGVSEVLMVGVLAPGNGLNGSWIGRFDTIGSTGCLMNIQQLDTAGYPCHYANAYDPWCHVFPGDFNGDGKADLLYLLGTQWNLCLSTGNSMGNPVMVLNSGMPHLDQSFNMYYPSLSLVDIQQANPHLVTLSVADYDGDGCSDIAYTLMTDFNMYFLSRIFIDNAAQVSFLRKKYSGMRLHSQFVHTGNFLGRDNLSILRSVHPSESARDNAAGIYSMASVGRHNSVTSVTDGLGNRTSFTYGCLMPEKNGTVDPFYTFSYNAPGTYGMQRKSFPVRALRTCTVEGAGGSSLITCYRYQNAVYHRNGHGFIGFERAVAETRRNSPDSPWLTRKLSVNEAVTMGRYAMMLPCWETTYVNCSGEEREVHHEGYTFENAVLSNGITDLVVCPAMTGKTERSSSMDGEGGVPFSIVNTDYQYDYDSGPGGGHTYDTAYGCTATEEIVTGYGNGVPETELHTVKVMYLDSHFPRWTLNRPDSVFVSIEREGEAVSTGTRYTYPSDSSLRPSSITVTPGNGSPAGEPLTLSTQYGYDAFGNTVSVTVGAPYGTHGETPRTIAYEYGDGFQHRLQTGETRTGPGGGYTTRYHYDFHGRLDSVTDPNGRCTRHYSSLSGGDRSAFLPDGTAWKSVTLWAGTSPYKPEGASYYTWEKKSGGVTAMAFRHKTGAVLRRVTFDLRGDPVFTDTRYNSDGLKWKESLPYRMGTPAEDIQWTVYHYDTHDRVTRIERPDGSAERYSYDGLETTVSVTAPEAFPDAVPQSAVKRLNALGWLAESTGDDGTSVFYGYRPDGRPKWARVENDTATTVSMEYDHAGNRTRLHDPDYCNGQNDLVSVYNAFGEEVGRTTPRQLTSSFTYDCLGRMTSRTEQDFTPDGTTVSRTTEWQYGEAAPCKGLLLSVTHPGQTVAYSYDTCQRMERETVQLPGGVTHVTRYTYDRASRIASVTHPSGFTVMQRYNGIGYPTVQTDSLGNELYRLNAVTPSGQPGRFTLGGFLENTLQYDPARNLLTGTLAKKGGETLQDLLYGYDGFCNLASRKDNMNNLEETFRYDNLNRLTEIRLGGVCTGTSVYDGYGRMTAKTASGQAVFSAAVYNASGKPHAIDKAATPSGAFPAAPQTVTYTGFDKVLKVKQGSDSLCYSYGHDRQRIAMEERVGNTLRTKRYVGNCEYITETVGNATSLRWITYLTGPTGVYAVVVTEDNMNTVHYVLKDNLGSWTAITDSEGNLEQRLNYDAWGNLRYPRTWENYPIGEPFVQPLFDRGFTGHEHLWNFGLINMDGRMYDPLMSSFLSADRFVQNPETAQGFNRYAYCMHNPLRYVDPSGWEMRKPVPGRTPNTSDFYMDPYAYAERALEPRDLGILQLPTSDPSVVWMEENEMHGGDSGEPIIDPSKLTGSQQKDFEHTISYASENSFLFKKILDCLTNSKTFYSIIIGKTHNNVPAEFQEENNTLIFRDEEALLSINDIVEELFHAYQSENKKSYNTNEFNFEFEAKVARYFIMEQINGLHETSIGTNFEIMHRFLSPNGIDALIPTSQSIQNHNFLMGYYEGARYFREWNIRNNYGNNNYKKKTLQTPKSLFELFKQ